MASAPPVDHSPISIKVFIVGDSGCVADTAKARSQVQDEDRSNIVLATGIVVARVQSPGAPIVSKCRGLRATKYPIASQGQRALYNGLSAELQRLMCFAGVRFVLYDLVKAVYLSTFNSGQRWNGGDVPTCVAAGITTGAMGVMLAQPTDFVKIRMQAQTRIYKCPIYAYNHIGVNERVVKGLGKRILSYNTINVAEMICYDIVKDAILRRNLMNDTIHCHLFSAVTAGFCASLILTPINDTKIKYMESSKGQYKSTLDCAIRMGMQEGLGAFYKGFNPTFYRLALWNVCAWIPYEQLKKLVFIAYNNRND